MAGGRRSHDFKLLDALGDRGPRTFEGTLWRVVRNGRSPLEGSRGAGRWNSRDMSVLYSAEMADGALAEVHYHISLGQSVFPSRLRHSLFELKLTARSLLVFDSLTDLAGLGVEKARYPEMLYEKTEEIASAAAFLGFEGLIAPSARWHCRNLIVFLDNFDEENLQVLSESPVDWADWKARRKR